MSKSLMIISLSFILILFIVITMFVRRNSISVKYSFIWYGSLFILFLFTIFPRLLKLITDLLNIQVASNLVFALMLGVLIMVTISLTIIVSKQKEHIKLLIQEVSLIKAQIGEKNVQRK